MKLEEGKYYKTRDGRKVGPIVINPITGVAQNKALRGLFLYA